MSILCRLTTLALLLTLPVLAGASDLDKEKRWAEQTVDAIIDGDVEWLNDGRSDFLAIYTEAEQDTDPKRGIIIMHGTGVHPDWQQVIQPLRVEMTTAGWNTLSIQMPILANEAEHDEYLPLYDEVSPRIDAAIKFLHDHGIQHIVLLGHSQGAMMGAHHLDNSTDGIAAFVAIGMASSNRDNAMNTVNALQTLNIPVLDLYGSDDLEQVLDARELKLKALRHKRSAQVKVDGANHFFDGMDDQLVAAVQKWLDTL